MGLLDFFWKMKETDAEAELKEMQEMMKLMDPSNVKFQGGRRFRPRHCSRCQGSDDVFGSYGGANLHWWKIW